MDWISSIGNMSNRQVSSLTSCQIPAHCHTRLPKLDEVSVLPAPKVGAFIHTQLLIILVSGKSLVLYIILVTVCVS
jgi:hypothetical protein